MKTRMTCYSLLWLQITSFAICKHSDPRELRMARLLHRLGAFSVRRRRTVLASWLVALGVMASAVAQLRGRLHRQLPHPGHRVPAGQRPHPVQDPGRRADAPSGRVVFAAPAGRTLASGAGRAAVERTIDAIERVPGVAASGAPTVSGGRPQSRSPAWTSRPGSADGRVAAGRHRAGVRRPRSTRGCGSSTPAPPPVADRAARRASRSASCSASASPSSCWRITFGSMIAAGLPLLTALLGVGFGSSASRWRPSVTSLSSESITLAVMLGLAVGIDYTLFILSRHRTQVRDGMGIEPSIARAVGTAGSAVVFAGATVIIALVALLVTGVPFLGQMGIAAAGTIAVAVLLSLTLVPALMAFAGPRATRGKSASAALHDPGADEKPTLGARWIALVMRRRVLAIAVPVLVLVALALPALDMRLGQANDGALGPDTTQRQAYDLLSDGFGPGFNGPLTIAAEVPPGDRRPARGRRHGGRARAPRAAWPPSHRRS